MPTTTDDTEGGTIASLVKTANAMLTTFTDHVLTRGD